VCRVEGCLGTFIAISFITIKLQQCQSHGEPCDWHTLQTANTAPAPAAHLDVLALVRKDLQPKVHGTIACCLWADVAATPFHPAR